MTDISFQRTSCRLENIFFLVPLSAVRLLRGAVRVVQKAVQCFAESFSDSLVVSPNLQALKSGGGWLEEFSLREKVIDPGADEGMALWSPMATVTRIAQ